jgi:SAM-dependent methyltransferase
MADSAQDARRLWTWRCLHCRGPLAADVRGLLCTACGRHYAVIADMPILVRNPAGYLRSELALLTRTSHRARQRKDSLDRVGRETGLPDASLERHRDIADTEIAQAEMFLALLEPATQALGDDVGEALEARPSGWTTDALIPYLLRDWTSTSELEAMHARIGAALEQAFPDPSGKSVVFAACGAGGLLAEVAVGFGRVVGFDLTLPVLRAARHLLDGNSLAIALPRAINQTGHVTLRKRDPGSASSHVELAAMDAFDTAFADGSVDCVVTSFMIDLIPDPPRLADEIARILCRYGVWINYGPSGPLKAFWRFDQTETAAFLEAAGFTVVGAEPHRATYLDLSRDCPTWSFQNHVCYLTWARKTGPGLERPGPASPGPTELPEIIPIHFPGANLVQRRGLGEQPTQTTTFRHEGIPGRPMSVQVEADAARILALVDGKRTVKDIAGLLERETPALSGDIVYRAFGRYFQQRLLSWRGR